MPATAAALAVPAAALAWWWAGRAVDPLRRVTRVADDIQLTSLDRRIGLIDAPDEVEDLAASFDRMLDRLEMATTAERCFVEDLSHQLRTPLAVLTTSADVALAEPHPTVEDHADAIRTIKQMAARLTVIVDDLLSSARSRQLGLRRDETDLTAMARAVVATAAPAARSRGVQVRVQGEDGVDAVVDEPSVARAVTALVENALRHSPAGATVTVEAGTTDDGRRRFVSVTDHGPGIPPEDAAHVFERYWSGDPDRAGLGIGLAIVKHVALANDGVDVTSPVGSTGGTRFTMWFRSEDRDGGGATAEG